MAKPSIRQGIKKFFALLGPGLVTGAADDDPSGIATCSQTGAQFGFGQLWTPLFMLPLMISVQEACARIGTCKGRGLANERIMGKFKSGLLSEIFIWITFLCMLASAISMFATFGK